MTDFTVLILLGSLRAASVNRLLALAAVAAVPAGITVHIQEGLDDLPHYNQDIDTPELRPVAVQQFADALSAADAVLVVTPQYNGTMSSVVKNAIDWGSRPARNSPLTGKPAAAIGATFGRHGGELSQGEARRALTTAGAVVVAEPAIGIGMAHERFATMPPEKDAILTAQLARLLESLREVSGQEAVSPRHE